jgi:uncharacterized protein YabE (DUF348 family)
MTQRRLPLPGEKPVSVWRPRHAARQRGAGRSLRTGAALAVGLAALLLAVWAWRATAITVTLIANGQPVETRTHSRTAGGAVRAAGIRAADMVDIRPPATTPLQPGMVITVLYRRPVIVHADGQTYLTLSSETDPRAVVEAAGVTLRPADGVRVERAAPADPPLPREVRVLRATTLTVIEAGSRTTFTAAAATLGEALAAAGYVLREADRVSLPLTTPLDSASLGGLEVTIARAAAVTVQADGATWVTYTHQPTVAALIGELGLAAGGTDYVMPGLDTPVQDGLAVRLVRVVEEVVSEREPIAFDTVYVPDPDLELDRQQMIQAGQDGVLERRIRVRYEDGLEVSRAEEGTWVLREPQAQVISYGTRIVIRRLETAEGTFLYWRHLRMLATSYSPLTADYKQPGDPFFGLTPTGIPLARGVVAIDPRVINMFTRMYVPGYGVGQALDVGGAIKGYRIDLGYSDADLVLWYNWVDVYLLLPVPPGDTINWLLPG